MAISPLLFFCLLLCCPPRSCAAGALARQYGLLSGVSSCARTITLSENATTLPASSISADGETCAGGTFTLGPVILEPTDPLSQALQTIAVVAGIHLAELDSPLICGAFVVSPKTRVYIIAPSVADVPLPEMGIPALGDLGPALGQAFAFVEGQAYLIIGTECVYMTTDEMMEEIEEANTTEAPVGPTCFPANAKVALAGGVTRRVDELAIGDEVSVGDGETSPVFAWTHRDATYESDAYVRIVAGERTLTLTLGHFVYANGQAVPAENIRRGDVMRGGDNGEALVVKDVRRVWAKGLYNPQTVHGDIVVDGFTVTTYTTAVTPNAAHALLAPLRACYAAISAALPVGDISA